VNQLHVERVPQHEAEVLLLTQIGQPVPAEDGFHTDDHALPVGSDHFEKRLRVAGDTAINYHVAFVIQDAHVHGPRVQIDAAVEWMVDGVEAHDHGLRGVGGLIPHRGWKVRPS
jgi:hypothetical protein